MLRLINPEQRLCTKCGKLARICANPDCRLHLPHLHDDKKLTGQRFLQDRIMADLEALDGCPTCGHEVSIPARFCRDCEREHDIAKMRRAHPEWFPCEKPGCGTFHIWESCKRCGKKHSCKQITCDYLRRFRAGSARDDKNNSAFLGITALHPDEIAFIRQRGWANLDDEDREILMMHYSHNQHIRLRPGRDYDELPLKLRRRSIISKRKPAKSSL